MQVRDVMTSPVITVTPRTTIHEIARLLLDRGISATPVVDADQHVLGLVSEADLLHRPEIGAERRPPGWLRLLVSEADAAHAYVKAHGVRAENVMTRRPVTIAPDADLNAVVTLMDRNDVKRCLVVEGERLVGIVTHADLLRGFVASASTGEVRNQDRVIRAALLMELRGKPWASIPAHRIVVADAIVRFAGGVRSDDEREALRVAAEGIPGVRAVEDNTFIRSDAPFGD